LALLPDEVVRASAAIPTKACRRSDSWWVPHTKGPDPRAVPTVALG
jgi:hypothetical protein